jgi:hypothetical protein
MLLLLGPGLLPPPFRQDSDKEKECGWNSNDERDYEDYAQQDYSPSCLALP